MSDMFVKSGIATINMDIFPANSTLLAKDFSPASSQQSDANCVMKQMPVHLSKIHMYFWSTCAICASLFNSSNTGIAFEKIKNNMEIPATALRSIA